MVLLRGVHSRYSLCAPILLQVWYCIPVPGTYWRKKNLRMISTCCLLLLDRPRVLYSKQYIVVQSYKMSSGVSCIASSCDIFWRYISDKRHGIMGVGLGHGLMGYGPRRLVVLYTRQTKRPADPLRFLAIPFNQ